MNNNINFRQRLGLMAFNKIYQKTIQEHELRTLFWETTLRCNLSCAHCGSDCRSEAQIKDMPKEDFLKVIEAITPRVNPNKVLVIFSGGEPLVRSDIEYCGLELYKKGYPWGLVTNGMLLDAKRFDSLLKAGLHSITVSLDGFKEYHNSIRGNECSFDNALRAAKLISSEPSIKYDVVTCVSSRNIADLPAFKEFLIEQGIEHWRLFTIFPAGRAAGDESLRVTDEQLVQLMRFIEQTRKEGRIAVNYACQGFLGGFEAKVRDSFYNCRAGVSTASIRIDGAISGCTSIRANFDQGNIYTHDFMDVWENGFTAYRDRSWAYKDECEGCKAWKWCQGGGMHLRGDNKELLECHYRRIVK